LTAVLKGSGTEAEKQAATLVEEPRRSSLRRLLRAANDEIARRARSARAVVLVCECEDPGCSSAVELPLQLFRVVQRRPRFHVVRPGHEAPLAEHVVRRAAEYAIVERRG
jgi:hypothetical protein